MNFFFVTFLYGYVALPHHFNDRLNLLTMEVIKVLEDPSVQMRN